jgi:hypothetical protein
VVGLDGAPTVAVADLHTRRALDIIAGLLPFPLR